MTDARERFEAWYSQQHFNGFYWGDLLAAWQAAEAQQQARIDELEKQLFELRHVNVGAVGHVDHGLAIKDLDHLRPFYTREGAIDLIKQHWPDLLPTKREFVVDLPEPCQTMHYKGAYYHYFGLDKISKAILAAGGEVR